MMVGVVENGTGTNVQIPGVEVAGKTGTANSAEDRSPYAWMVTFAPADDAEVAVAVFIESTAVERGEVSGNGLAGPIAKADHGSRDQPMTGPQPAVASHATQTTRTRGLTR